MLTCHRCPPFPWVSYFEPGELKARPRSAGFPKVEFLSPAEAEARYFRQRLADLPVPKPTNILTTVLSRFRELAPPKRHGCA